MLNKKLFEECNELIDSENKCDRIEEIADILEVLFAICNYFAIDKDELEKIRIKKLEQKGAFKKKILLKKVINLK